VLKAHGGALLGGCFVGASRLSSSWSPCRVHWAPAGRRVSSRNRSGPSASGFLRMYTILYTCDVVSEMKPEMTKWAGELLPFCTRKFVFHRSTRSAGIDSPELVAYFDFADEVSAQEFWSS
jgi:hypothetical protein